LEYLVALGVEDEVGDHPAFVGLGGPEGDVEDGGSEGVAFEAVGLEVLDEEEEGDDALLAAEELG
jgi:hypothetical protein